MRRECLSLFGFLAATLCSVTQSFGSGCTLTGNAPTITATDIDFMAYSASAALPTTANGTVKIRCPLGIGLLPSFDVALSAGNAGSFSPRKMTLGSDGLTYNIFTTTGHSAIWGDGNSGSVTQSFSAILSLGTISFTAYGLIPTGQYVPTGTYSDTITVTVTY